MCWCPMCWLILSIRFVCVGFIFAACTRLIHSLPSQHKHSLIMHQHVPLAKLLWIQRKTLVSTEFTIVSHMAHAGACFLSVDVVGIVDVQVWCKLRIWKWQIQTESTERVNTWGDHTWITQWILRSIPQSVSASMGESDNHCVNLH